MHRPLLIAIAVAATATLLAGCVDGRSASTPGSSSSASARPPATSAAVAGGGGIEYAGPVGGTIAWTTAVCTVAHGRLTAMTTPDPTQSVDPPSLAYAVTDGASARLTLADGRAVERTGTLEGVVAGEHRGVWSISFASTALDDPSTPQPVTISGEITCSRIEKG